MNNQNPDNKSKQFQNSPFQQNSEVPPPTYTSFNPNQPQYVIHQQAAQPVYYQQQPNFPIYRNQIVLLNAPIAQRHQRYQYMCGPTYLPNIDERRINLLENYPVCFVIMHCIITMLLAAVQIAAECVSNDHMSAYYGMTVGWYSGGFMIACAIFTMVTVCIRQVSLVRIAVIFNLLMFLMNLGFAIIMPTLDMTDSNECFKWNPTDHCIVRPDIDIIINADIAKIVSGAIAIKMYVIFTMYITRVLRNKRYASTSYEYVNPNYMVAQGQAQVVPQTQIISQTQVPNINNYNSI